MYYLRQPTFTGHKATDNRVAAAAKKPGFLMKLLVKPSSVAQIERAARKQARYLETKEVRLFEKQKDQERQASRQAAKAAKAAKAKAKAKAAKAAAKAAKAKPKAANSRRATLNLVKPLVKPKAIYTAEEKAVLATKRNRVQKQELLISKMSDEQKQKIKREVVKLHSLRKEYKAERQRLNLLYRNVTAWSDEHEFNVITSFKRTIVTLKINGKVSA